MHPDSTSSTRESAWFWLAAAALAGILVAYSQIFAFAWDEGFHLIAAQLIKSGKRPYIDFIFAQTPLNAYWNATWMRVFGDNWRPLHAISALVSTGALVLAARFLKGRFTGWGFLSLIAALVIAGANVRIVEFGTVSQAYPFALLLIVGAFRSAVVAIERESIWLAALAGLLASAAAASTLLTAMVAPVLLIWIVVMTPSGKRVSRAVAFVAGAVIPLLPLLVLFLQSPERVIFDVFRYHLFFRRSDWPGATRHDLEIFASWIDNPQPLILATLAMAGTWFVAKKSNWEYRLRQEFYLAGWIALGVGLHISTAHPTFPQYYMLIVPFLGILAAVGFYSVATQFGIRDGFCPTVALITLMCLGLVKSIYDKREDQTWPRLEEVARKVNEVTPPGGSLYADEPISFLAHRTPFPGNEYLSSHKLRLPDAEAELVHIIPQPEIDRRIAAGMYDTIETCEDDDWIEERKLTEIYRQKATPGECTVFWDKK